MVLWGQVLPNGMCDVVLLKGGNLAGMYIHDSVRVRYKFSSEAEI